MSPTVFLRRRSVQLAAVGVVALAAGFFGARVLREPGVSTDRAETPVGVEVQGRIDQGLRTLYDIQTAGREVASKVPPAVVEIGVTDLIRERELRRAGLGSGVIVKSTGGTVYVLTTNHVAGETEEISVTLADGHSFPGTLVGADDKMDLALVSFQSDDPVVVAELGDFDALQVVGISTWIASPSGGSVGLGFAIPTNNARRAIEEFISNGKLSYGWLGVSMGELPDRDAADLYSGSVRGAFVFGVVRGSPADRAGIQAGDTIVRVNDTTIADPTELLLAVGNLEPGASATFGIRRGTAELRLDAVITGRGHEGSLAARTTGLWPGLSVVRITPEIRSRLRLPRGTGNLIISAVAGGSPAQVADLRVGDILHEAGGHTVGSLEDFYRAVNSPDTNELLLTVTRQGQEYSVGLVR